MSWRVPSDFDALKLYAVLSRISDQLSELQEAVMTQSTSVQGKLDSIASQIGQIDEAVNSAVQKFRDEISQLSGQGVDTSGLEAAVAKLNDDVSAATSAAQGTVASAGGDSTPPADTPPVDTTPPVADAPPVADPAPATEAAAAAAPTSNNPNA